MKRQVEIKIAKYGGCPVSGVPTPETAIASVIGYEGSSPILLVMALVIGILVLTGCTTYPRGEGNYYPSNVRASDRISTSQDSIGSTSSVKQAANAAILSAEAVKHYAIMLHKDIPVRRKQIATDALIQARADLEQIYTGLAESNRKIRNLVRSCRNYWNQMTRILTAPASQSGLIALFSLSESLYIEHQKLVNQLTIINGSHRSPEAVAAYKVSILVTDLASRYLAVSMGINKATLVTQIAEMTSQIERTLLHLRSFPENTAQIQGLIRSTYAMEWKTVRKYSNEIQDGGSSEFKALVVAVFSARVAEKSERLALLFNNIHIASSY